jgi:multidrug efflux pump subunit AcrA (membrane-fusion protein)
MTTRRTVRLLLMAAAVYLVACSHETAEEVESETVVPVTTVTATTGSIRATLDVTGIITAAPGADQLVIAPQPARIAEITKAEGDQVKAGDLLVRFEIPTLAADVASRREIATPAAAEVEQPASARQRMQLPAEIDREGVHLQLGRLVLLPEARIDIGDDR